jgi:glycosyltransferase involved in cell wall biosynthesis
MTKKILHMHFGKEGGAERFFVNLVQGFREAGIEQRFIVRPNRLWTGEVTAIGPTITSEFRRWSPASPLLRWRVARMAATWQPDVIMAWMSRASRLMPAAPKAAKVTRLGDYPRHIRNFGNIDCIVGNTPDIEAACTRLGWTRRTAVVPVYPRAVDLRPVPRADMDTPQNAFVVVGSGRFIGRKGFDTLIRAVHRVPGAYLWLVGDGEDRAALQALVAELGMTDRTRFTGWVDEAMHYVAAGDVFVMPSRHEPFGNVIMEAWACRVPAVLTRSEGPRWVATDGGDSLLVDIDDAAAMAGAIARLRDDPALAARLVAGGSAALATRFNKDRVVTDYLDLFASLAPMVSASASRS